MSYFRSLKIPAFIQDSLTRLQITTPTPIQEQAIEPALQGTDILASAQTGSGKTLAYLIPLINNLINAPKNHIALILVPTRELAIQVRDSALQILERNSPHRIATIIGGEPIGKQAAMLSRNPRIVIGTPGRVNDLLSRNILELENGRFLVIDEVDRMLDIGFSKDLEKIVQFMPKERQTFMFSATMPGSIRKLSEQYLNNPKTILLEPETEPTAHIVQESVQVAPAEKFGKLVQELETREGSVIVFVKTKIGAKKLAEKLRSENQAAEAIHGDLRQRKREQVIQDFRRQRNRIMVATDIAARGIDIDHIRHVINYDVPQCPQDYVHRIGRTGRAGREGNALSLIIPDEMGIWKSIQRFLNRKNADDSYAQEGNTRYNRGGGGGNRRRGGYNGGGYSGGRSSFGGNGRSSFGGGRRRSF